MKSKKSPGLVQTALLPGASKKIRIGVFLSEMKTVAQWSRLEATFEPGLFKKMHRLFADPFGDHAENSLHVTMFLLRLGNVRSGVLRYVAGRMR